MYHYNIQTKRMEKVNITFHVIISLFRAWGSKRRKLSRHDNNASAPFYRPQPFPGPMGGGKLLRCHYRDISAFPVNAADTSYGIYGAIDDTEETRVLGRVSIKRQDGRSIAPEPLKPAVLFYYGACLLLSELCDALRKFVATPPPKSPLSKTSRNPG